MKDQRTHTNEDFDAPPGYRLLLQVFGRTMEEAKADIARIFGPSYPPRVIYMVGVWRPSTRLNLASKWAFNIDGGYRVFVRKR